MGMPRGNNISFRNFGKTIQSNYIRFFGTPKSVISCFLRPPKNVYIQ